MNSDFLAGLNPEQREAVSHVEGPLLILAGAGSGKTRVVTHRISHLIRNHGVAPDRILAVTFTNKAAAEMRERVEHLLGSSLPPGRGPLISTFHSFCVRLLRRDGAALTRLRPGFTRDFLIYDDDDQLALLKSLFREAALDEKELPPRQVLSAISHAKNRGETAADLRRRARDQKARTVAALFEQYDDALARANALDFDDLLLEAVRLLDQDPPTRSKWQNHLDFLMIDEYQDTNRTQYELIRLLTGPHRNVCAVGDEDQSIYSWRGADIRNILDFERDFPNARIIRLEQNYRSTKNILDAAGAVIAHNTERKGKRLWTEAGAGPKITIYEAATSEQEGIYIADRIERLLGEDPGTRVAVLYRTNAQSRQIEEGLRRYRRSYKVVGGLSFYQRAEIKDLLAYLKLLLVPSDRVSLLRVINVPARGIGRTTVEQVEAWARAHAVNLTRAIEELVEQQKLAPRAHAALGAFSRLIGELREQAAALPVNQLLAQVVERTGYREMLAEDKSPAAESRLENIDELLNAAADAAERGEGLREFLDHAALVSDADQVDTAAPICLMTAHNAKGLEFPVVFLAGMEEGLFPHSRSLDNERMLEEERRLCYVGMTRARQRLFLTYARERRRFGGSPLEPASPSRFLAELPLGLCDFTGVGRGYRDSSPETAEVDLYAERHYVRESARLAAEQIREARARRSAAAANPTPYPGKTYNSVENIAEFFRERGIPSQPAGGKQAVSPPEGARVAGHARPAPPPPAGKKKKVREGSTIEHSKYGRGTVVRVEGEGPDAKITVLFPGHGMKKLVAKYAGIPWEP